MQMSLQIDFDKTNVTENTRKIICDSMHWHLQHDYLSNNVFLPSTNEHQWLMSYANDQEQTQKACVFSWDPTFFSCYFTKAIEILKKIHEDSTEN